MPTTPSLSNPQAIAEAGERIYRERYKQEYEAKHPGWYVLIDVRSSAAFVAATPEQAVEAARKGAPSGVFHLIRIGEAGAFRVSHRAHASNSRIFR